jgi:16S rRNA C1402 (ribose-2'-O) methylase RsmI
VSREISKVHEEHVRGHARELAKRFAETRGECVIVIESPAMAPAAAAEIAKYMGEMRRAGARRSAAAAEAARRFGCTRENAYAAWDES